MWPHNYPGGLILKETLYTCHAQTILSNIFYAVHLLIIAEVVMRIMTNKSSNVMAGKHICLFITLSLLMLYVPDISTIHSSLALLVRQAKLGSRRCNVSSGASCGKVESCIRSKSG
eukprot:6491495-Amphidinium_carterae.2